MWKQRKESPLQKVIREAREETKLDGRIEGVPWTLGQCQNKESEQERRTFGEQPSLQRRSNYCALQHNDEVSEDHAYSLRLKKQRLAVNDVSFRQEKPGHGMLPTGGAARDYESVGLVLSDAKHKCSSYQLGMNSPTAEATALDDFGNTGFIQDYASFVTETAVDASLPPTRIPEQYHAYQENLVAQLGDANTEVLYNDYTNKFEKQIFPSMKPSGRVEVVLLARLLDKMLTGIHRCTALQPDWHPPEYGEEEMHVWDLTLSEVVRQAHVHCAERGVLLERLRVRVAFLVKALGSHFQSLQKVLQNVASKLKQVSAACEAAQSGQLVDVQAAESESEEEDLVDIEDVHEDGHFDQDIQEFGLQVRDEMEGELRVDGKKRKVGLNELLTKNGIRGALSMMCISGPRTIGTQTSKVFVYSRKQQGEGPAPCEVCETDINLLSLCWSCKETQQTELDKTQRMLSEASKREQEALIEMQNCKDQCRISQLQAEAAIQEANSAKEELASLKDEIKKLNLQLMELNAKHGGTHQTARNHEEFMDEQKKGWSDRRWKAEFERLEHDNAILKEQLIRALNGQGIEFDEYALCPLCGRRPEDKLLEELDHWKTWKSDCTAMRIKKCLQRVRYGSLIAAVMAWQLNLRANTKQSLNQSIQSNKVAHKKASNTAFKAIQRAFMKMTQSKVALLLYDWHINAKQIKDKSASMKRVDVVGKIKTVVDFTHRMKMLSEDLSCGVPTTEEEMRIWTQGKQQLIQAVASEMEAMANECALDDAAIAVLLTGDGEDSLSGEAHQEMQKLLHKLDNKNQKVMDGMAQVIEQLKQHRDELVAHAEDLETKLKKALESACPDLSVHKRFNEPSVQQKNQSAEKIQRSYRSKHITKQLKHEKIRVNKEAAARTIQWIGVQVNMIYTKKWHIDQINIKQHDSISSMPIYIYEYLLETYGVGRVAEDRLGELLKTVAKFAPKSCWINMFQRFLNETWDLKTLSFFFNVLQQIDKATQSKSTCHLTHAKKKPIVRLLSEEIWLSIVMDPKLLGDIEPTRLEVVIDRLKRRAEARCVENASFDHSMDMLLGDEAAIKVEGKPELKYLSETDVLEILCEEHIDLETSFQKAVTEICSTVLNGKTKLTYGQFLRIVDHLQHGESMDSKESVRIWKIALPKAQEKDGMWEQATMTVEGIMVGIMHPSSALRYTYRKHCGTSKMSSAVLLSEDEIGFYDALRDQWTLFEPVISHHIKCLAHSEEDEAETITTLRNAVVEMMSKKVMDTQDVILTLGMYSQLLEIVTQQVFALASHGVELGSATNLVRWNNSKKVLNVMEDTIKHCHRIHSGGTALPYTMSREDGSSALVHKVDTAKYIRAMSTALQRSVDNGVDVLAAGA